MPPLCSGLARLPLTQVAPVRIRSGVPHTKGPATAGPFVVRVVVRRPPVRRMWESRAVPHVLDRPWLPVLVLVATEAQLAVAEFVPGIATGLPDRVPAW